MLKIFSIVDMVADSFNVPFFMPTQGAAIRAFADLCTDPQSKINAHPGDYKLVLLGSFDPLTGKITVSDPVSLGTGADYIKPAAALSVVNHG